MKEKGQFIPGRFLSIAVGCILIAGLIVSYKSFVRKAQLLDYQVFNLQETVSWRQTKEGIYRIAAKENYDTIAPSTDKWGNFELSFILLNLREAGLIYRYHDTKNFHFILLDRDKRSIVWATQRDGKSTLIKKARLNYSKALPCLLTIKDKKGKLFINQELVLEVDIEDEPENPRYSRIGLLLKKADFPPTVFSRITIKGKTESGDAIVTNVDDEARQNERNFQIWLVLLYIFMLALSVYISNMLIRSNQRIRAGPDLLSQSEDRLNFFVVCLVHLGITVFLFWPFVFRGEIIVSSADNFGEIYPLFFLSKHVFNSMPSYKIFADQLLGLWNPYAHNGLPFFSNHWNMMYYPLNWIIFLFQDKDVLSILTLRTFLEVFLVGIFAYKFFVIELQSRRWALLCSITYQLSSLLIFNLTIFPSISLFFATTMYLYVLWSMSTRRMIWNFLYLSISTAIILTSANLAFLFYGGLSLTVFTIYRLISVHKDWDQRREDFEIVLTSALVGFMIAAVRIIPAIIGVMDSNRLVENYYTLHDRIPMVTRLFLPEIVGWFGANSFNALTAKTLNLIYFQANLPSNSQNTFLVYFGILAALVLLVNFFISSRGAHTFWKVYAFVGIALGLMFQPFWGIFNVLLFPFNHYSYYIIILPVAVCALIGHTGKYLVSEKTRVANISNKFFIALIGIQFYIIIFLTYLFPSLSGRTRLTILAVALWYIAYYFLAKRSHLKRNTFISISSMVLTGVLWITIFLASKVLIIKPIDAKQYVSVIFTIPIMLAFCVILLSMWLFINQRKLKRLPYYKFWLACFVIVMPIIIIHIISGPQFYKLINLNDAHRSYVLDIILGQSKFILVSLIGIFIVALYKVRRLTTQSLMLCLIVITLLDLMAFNVRFDNVVAPSPRNKAFYPKTFPYADLEPQTRSKLDLVNYRVTNLHNGGVNSNKNLIFKVPSYSGIMGHMPQRFSNLIQSFGYPKETVLIYPSESTSNERFLDLSAVKYDFVNKNVVQERPNALSRLRLYYSYKIVHEEEKLLEQLQSPSFDPQRTVLFEEDPGFGPVFTRRRMSEFIPIFDDERLTSDRVSAQVDTRVQAVLLFTESFSKDWRAFIDGERVPVYRANYNFMACLVQPGDHTVEFRYEPRLFKFSRNITLLGAVFLLMSMIVLLFYDPKGKE